LIRVFKGLMLDMLMDTRRAPEWTPGTGGFSVVRSAGGFWAMKVTKMTGGGRNLPWKLDGYFAGRRVRRFFATRGEADGEMRRLSADRAATGSEGERLSPRERMELADLRDEVAAAGGSLREAVAYWLEHAAAPQVRMSLEDLLEAALARKDGEGKSARYLGQLRSSVGQLCRWRGMGGRWAHELTRREVEAWVEGNGWASKTRRNYLIDVRTVLEYGRSMGVVRVNATDGMVLPSGVADGEVAILSTREAARLVALARPRAGREDRDGALLVYVVLGLFAGLRPERELGLLRLGALDLEGGTVVVNAGSAKSRSRRVVDLSPPAVALLRMGRASLVEYWRARGFNGAEAEMGVVPRNCRRRWESLRESAGLLDGWVGDVMRHSFASYHLAVWENEGRLKAQMGHAAGSEVLWQHYRARVTRREAERFWRIGGR